MGTTYSNCQVRSDSQEAVVAALRGLLKEPAYVAPAVNGWVGVYPEGVRTDPDKLAKQLSAKLSGGVFSWNVYDSDVFAYSLYENGRLRDKFDSNPDCFEPASQADKVRLRGKPEALVPYCLPGIGYSQVKEVLHPSLLGEDKSNGATMPSENSLQLFSNLLKITTEAMKSEFENKHREKYLFADQQADDLAALLGMDEDLSALDHRHIAHGKRDIDTKDFMFISSDMLSEENLKKKLWELSMQVDKIKAAINQGADVNELTEQGEPFLLFASLDCAAEVVQLLLKAGADVNAATTKTNKYGWELGVTALMAAVGGGARNKEKQIETVQILMSEGADVTAKSEAGRTALEQAQQLLELNSTQKGDWWYSEKNLPEDYARYLQIIEMLRAAGATE